MHGGAIGSLKISVRLEAVADKGVFTKGEPTPKVGVLTNYFAIFFAQNCIKMKEFGPQGDARPWRPPPLIRQWEGILNKYRLDLSTTDYQWYFCYSVAF